MKFLIFNYSAYQRLFLMKHMFSHFIKKQSICLPVHFPDAVLHCIHTMYTYIFEYLCVYKYGYAHPKISIVLVKPRLYI